MSARAKIVTWVLALVLGAFTLACESDGRSQPQAAGGVPKGAPGPARMQDPLDPRLGVVVLTAYVEPGNPYTVDFSATDHVTGQSEHPNPTLPANKQQDLQGQWTYTCVWIKGHASTVTIKITATKTGSKLGYVYLQATGGKTAVATLGGIRVAVTEINVK